MPSFPHNMSLAHMPGIPPVRIQPRHIRRRRLHMHHLPRRRITNTLFAAKPSRRIRVKRNQLMRMTNGHLLHRLLKISATNTRVTNRHLYNVDSLNPAPMVSTRHRHRFFIHHHRLLNSFRLPSSTTPRPKPPPNPPSPGPRNIRLIAAATSSITIRPRRGTGLLQKPSPILHARNMHKRP